MKLLVLFAFLLLSSSSFALLIPDGKKIDIAIEKYQYGYYEECLLILNKFTNPAHFSKNPVQSSDAYALKAASYLRLSYFNLYSKTLSDWKNLLTESLPDSARVIGQFKLAQLFLEVGDYKSCDSILRNIPENGDVQLESDVRMVKGCLLFYQGNINEAGKIIADQLVERKRKIDKGIKKDVNFVILNNHKKIYAELIFQKIKIAIVQGKVDSAKATIALHKSWLANQLPDGYFYRELDRLSGELELSRNDISMAYDFFNKSYQYGNFSDGDYKKIELLSSVVFLSSQLGLTDYSQKMLRRLQMFASVSSGKQEPFQYAYERTIIRLDIERNKFSDASDRLIEFSDNYSSLPLWHPVKLSFAQLESDLLLYKAGLDISHSLDSLILFYQRNFDQGHVHLLRLLVQKISYDINFGSGITNVNRDLEKLNKIFISNGYAGTYLLQYFELSSTYYLILDNSKLYKEYAEKAYTYSGQLYGDNSEKRIYYQAIFLKSCLYAGDYKEFYAQFEQLKKHFSTISWESKDEKRKSYLAISDIYELIGDKDDSKSVLIKIVNELDESGKENIYVRSKTESQLAHIYYQTGNLFKAEKLIKKAYEAEKALLMSGSVAFIDELFFIATIELQKGNFKETEKSLELASGIISNAYGESCRLYAEYLKLHADYCISIGDYKRGGEYIHKSQTIILEKFGKDDLSNVSLLVRKAFILSQNDVENMDLASINSLYSESLSILSETIGKENVLFMDVLKKNAHFLIKINQLNKADSLLSIVENYWKKSLGAMNQELLEVYLLKGDICYEKNEFKNAASRYQSVKDIASALFDTKNSYYTRAYARQAKVAYMQNKPEEALAIMEDLLPNYLHFVSKNFPALSFREKSKYWNNMKDEFEFYVFLVLSNKELTDKYSKDVFNNVISTKAILLSNNIKIRENIMASKDSVLINAYDSWINLKEYYTSVSSLTKAEQEEQKIDLKSIETEIEKREKQLSNKSELFKTEDKISNATLKDISSVLMDNEYAVEVVRYRNFYKNFTDTINYAALIVKKNSVNPEVILFPNGNLFEQKSLKLVRNAARYHVKDKVSYTTFWAPIQRKIPVGATVYLSSEGAYNQFNVEMLSDSSGVYVLDKIELVQVTNTKELLRYGYYSEKQKGTEGSSEVVLGGNPDFYKNDSIRYATHVNNLPGAAKEVEDLSTLLASNNTKVAKVMGDELTEEWVKDLSNPKVFHIATHGFYSDVKNSEDENSALLNSGLLLCGAGDILGSESHVNSQDGILTAYEAMNLKLDHTDLVVLSACETGLGEVKAGEGVYGLQRSFLIAGSKAIIISLYKVNDEVTQKLMLEFYSNWISSGDIRKSFIISKQKLKSEYPDVPIYWGAFVLIEGRPQLKRDAGKKAGGM